MRALFWCLLVLAVAVPVYAGHGTIEETDDAVIVEFTGDATDKANDNRASSNTAATAATAAAPRQSYESKPQGENNDQSPNTDRRRSRRGRYRRAASGENTE